jgi:2-aminoethylphosphonate dioxygenase
MKSLRKEYSDYGFFIKQNFLDIHSVEKIIDEIGALKENIDIYYDKKGNLRRIEKFYNKGESLLSANKKISIFLKEIFNIDFTIFKDKFNAKPPGGEGFFAHYDGVFNFKNEKNEDKNGWYEYGDLFVNVLIALDPCNAENGTIEIASSHNKSFNELLSNTKKNGTPDILAEVEKELKFNIINLKRGDIVIFNNTCPHRSKKNNSKTDRKTLYYTYTPLKYGSKYEEYFNDKLKSKNKSSKSLSGDF